MRRKRRGCYSGIGGQAVLEGVMMKNREKYAVAVRKPDGDIEVEVEAYEGVWHGNKIKELPFIRGIFNFMVLGTKCLNYSAHFYEDEETDETGMDKTLNTVSKGKGEKILMGFTTFLAIIIAVALFIVLPYFITSLFREYVRNASLMAILEGALRILIFVLYVAGISAMKDIKRLYRYHGAEHKCINCLERGHRLTVRNVRNSSRLHKRCGTSFMFLVLFISIILFFFILVESPVQRMLLQRLTTKEPDDSMIEVAIASVEAVFDWKAYLRENFGKDFSEEDFEAGRNLHRGQGEEESPAQR